MSTDYCPKKSKNGGAQREAFLASPPDGLWARFKQQSNDNDSESNYLTSEDWHYLVLWVVDEYKKRGIALMSLGGDDNGKANKADEGSA